MERDISAEIEFYDFCSEGLTFSDPDVVEAIPATREEISRLFSLGEKPEPRDMDRLKRVDDYVISNIDGLPDDFDEDDPNQPLEKWWWHLKAIKEGRIPREFLPTF